VLVTTALLASVVAVSVLASVSWPAWILLAAAALVPILLPLRGLLRGSRRAHAAASLCVLPYFVAGLTETIANPARKLVGPWLLLASVAWFVTLVYYLRVTRPATSTLPPVPPGPA
jgi:uncharacterized membrane protein